MDAARRSAALQSLGFLIVSGAILFGTAGGFAFWNFWAYLAIYALVFLVSMIAVDPELMRERMRPGGRRVPWAMHLALTLMFIHLAVAGLDCGRLHWSDTVPTALVAACLVLALLADLFALWAMRVNRFFSSVVRLQRDRGQTVIDTGPYAWVRHPGYAAALVAIPASGIALGSWLAAAAITVPVLPFLVSRALREERLLRAELDGYDDYTRRVRWRMVPGVW